MGPCSDFSKLSFKKVRAMKSLIVGASGALGRTIAMMEAEKGHDLVLMATDRRDLLAMSHDIQLRFKVSVEIHQIDFRVVAEVLRLPVTADRYYFPIGISDERDLWGQKWEIGSDLFQVNALSTFHLINHILLTKGSREIDLVAFGSIAETRGRGSNIYYSAAKRALTSFFESLLHSQDRQSVRPFLFQLGYLKSQQSLGKRLLFPVVEPNRVVNRVVRVLEKKATGIYYYPRFWRLVCFVLRNLPWVVYRKIQF